MPGARKWCGHGFIQFGSAITKMWRNLYLALVHLRRKSCGGQRKLIRVDPLCVDARATETDTADEKSTRIRYPSTDLAAEQEPKASSKSPGGLESEQGS